MRTIKLLTFILLLLPARGICNDNSPAEGIQSRNVTFRFVAGSDMFYIPWEGNGEQLTRLYAIVDEYRAEIVGGKMPVYVDGYCASLPTARENLNTAYIRANRVKSELITHKGLSESNFITKNYGTAYTTPDGQQYRDVVVVTVHIPVKEIEQAPEPVVEITPQPGPQPEPVEEKQPVVAEREPQPEPVTLPSDPWRQPYLFAIRTNLLYDAFLLPTLGVEWRVNQHVGIKLDGSRSWWGDAGGKVQKIWLVSPEVRWYLLDAKRFYVGLGANFGKANIYNYPLGNIIQNLYTKDTGYQGKFWNAGATVGYQLYLSRDFSLDFNVGLGYTRFEYDTFTVIDGVRTYKGKDLTKNFWGPTQAGISLVWTLGGK